MDTGAARRAYVIVSRSPRASHGVHDREGWIPALAGMTTQDL